MSRPCRASTSMRRRSCPRPARFVLPESVPKKLAVIGAGVIGLELGSCLSAARGRGGGRSNMLDRIAARHGHGEISKHLPAPPGESKVSSFHLGQKVTKVESTKVQGGAIVTLRAGGAVASPRSARGRHRADGGGPASRYTEGLGLEEAGVATWSAAASSSTITSRTNVPGIYAIGDVVRGPDAGP